MKKVNKLIQFHNGQSTLEYVLLVTGVIVVLVAFTQAKNFGLKKAVHTSLNSSTTALTNMSGRLENAFDGQLESSVPSGMTPVPVIPGGSTNRP